RPSQIFRRRHVSPEPPRPAFFDELKDAYQPLLTLLLALQVDGCQCNCYSQFGFLTSQFNPRDFRTAKTNVLACELLLQAFLMGREVWRFLNPKCDYACQVFLAVGSKKTLNYGT